MTIFYLIRHGETSWKTEEIINAHARLKNHAPLTKRGVDQLIDTSKDKRLLEAELIISSPYTRALQSAAILSRKLDKDLVVEYNLHEWLLDKYFRRKDINEMNSIIQDFYQNRGIHNKESDIVWESAQSVKHRVEKVMSKYKEYDKVILVCHQMIIKILTEGEDITKDEINFGSIVEYEYE